MRKRPFGIPSLEARRAWVDVAMGRRAPSRYLRGGRVLNVFTGEVLPAGVAIVDDRIAYVGPEEPAIDATTIIDDVTGYVLVPGYIEIHVHPFQLNTPAVFAQWIASRGTTTIVADTLQILSLFRDQASQLLDADLGAPVRVLWGLRTGPQTELLGDDPIRAAFGLTAEQLAALLDHPRVVEVFEWSAWQETVRQGAPLPPVVAAALERGLPVDAHAPGASSRTLAGLAAAGASDCHESLNVEDVLARLRLGLYAPLRYSSLRPDLPELVAAVRATDGFERLMLTSDGAMPDYLRAGLMDQVIQTAIDNGVAPADAIRMATLHPASYLGLDGDLGALAPGRLADILVLEDPARPTPVRVYLGGRPLEEQAQPDWGPEAATVVAPALRRAPAVDAFRLRPEHVGLAAQTAADRIEVPVIELSNAVITRLATAELPVRDATIDFTADPSLVLAVLVDPAAGRAVRALVRGLGRIDGLASTYTCAFQPLVLGRNPEAMARAAARLARSGPGISLFDA
ncbi:MAG TPA: amidohydrolase family protein, partial [Bacillota bacterium]